MELSKMRLVLEDDVNSYKTNEKSVVVVDEDGNVLSHNVIHNNEKVEIKKDLTEKQKYRINQNKDMKDFIECNEGNFIHNLYKYCYPYMLDLQELDDGSKNNIHIIRFIVLSTYLSKDGYIRYENRKFKKSKLGKIWDTSSRNSRNQTYNKLISVGYIYEDQEGFLMINTDIMANGKVIDFNKIKNKDYDYTYTRLFSKNIQDMYYNCNEKKRKLLANLFKILPFVNFKYNVFCSNPIEINEDDIDVLTWTDLARICGYEEKKHISKFKRDMLNLEIYEGISTLGIFIGSRSRHMICINPKIYYGGGDVEKVKHLYAMFQMVDNSSKYK